MCVAISLDLREKSLPFLSTKNILLLLTPESKVSQPYSRRQKCLGRSQGSNHENRSDRRQRTYRIKTRAQVARAGARSICSFSQFGRQHRYRLGAGRSAEGRGGGC